MHGKPAQVLTIAVTQYFVRVNRLVHRGHPHQGLPKVVPRLVLIRLRYTSMGVIQARRRARFPVRWATIGSNAGTPKGWPS